jgi:hypothetical protein
MDLLKIYLEYIQEKEWEEDPENSDAFDQKVFSKVIGGPKSSVDPFNDVRHDLDTNYFDIYMKNMLGDYKGRTDRFNVTADRMPFGKDDPIKRIRQLRKDYEKIATEPPESDDDDNARYKAKPRPSRSPDDDFELRDDNANIVVDGNDDGVGEIGGGDGGGE